MLDALFIKVFFHIGVAGFIVVITSNFLDLKLKFLFFGCSCNDDSHLAL
jgi:hypothetical protein